MISKFARPNNVQLGPVITSLYSLPRSCKWPCVSSIFWEHHKHVINKQTLSFSTTPSSQPPTFAVSPPPPTPTTLHTPMMMIAWQWHVTSPLVHAVSDDIQWRWHTVSNDIRWRRWWHMSLLLSTLLKVSNLTLSPLPSFHTRSRCHVDNGNVATNNKQMTDNEVSHLTALPLSFLQTRSRYHIILTDRATNNWAIWLPSPLHFTHEKQGHGHGNRQQWAKVSNPPTTHLSNTESRYHITESDVATEQWLTFVICHHWTLLHSSPPTTASPTMDDNNLACQWTCQVNDFELAMVSSKGPPAESMTTTPSGMYQFLTLIYWKTDY